VSPLASPPPDQWHSCLVVEKNDTYAVISSMAVGDVAPERDDRQQAGLARAFNLIDGRDKAARGEGRVTLYHRSDRGSGATDCVAYTFTCLTAVLPKLLADGLDVNTAIRQAGLGPNGAEITGILWNR
jgi:hypothetical protein